MRQLDERHNHWTTRIGGVRREFDTEIVDQLPDDRITWRVVDGETRQRGSVRFERLDDTHTRVELTTDVEPSGMAEKGRGHARYDRPPGQRGSAPLQGLHG
ncbi:cyclase/dehydrase [Actinobacteria bacterium OK006]|nr:cyclase/dehydrase [Actinobacteria bacterium OK006]